MYSYKKNYKYLFPNMENNIFLEIIQVIFTTVCKVYNNNP